MMKNYFTSENYSDHIIRIKGIDTTASYLVVGKDKTCLIDTGMGAGSLKDYIEKRALLLAQMIVLILENTNVLSFFLAKSMSWSIGLISCEA